MMKVCHLKYSVDRCRRILEVVMDMEKAEDIGNIIRLF
jgi:hypothetical protein